MDKNNNLHQPKLRCSKSFKFEGIQNRLIQSENIGSYTIIGLTYDFYEVNTIT